ncbi:hypothetical protein PULV_a0488 [Pseudoalteromonas ulvae UL12]|nr:hypothetical protein [Pseudoalteromonas ulvae UL12]
MLTFFVIDYEQVRMIVYLKQAHAVLRNKQRYEQAKASTNNDRVKFAKYSLENPTCNSQAGT